MRLILLLRRKTLLILLIVLLIVVLIVLLILVLILLLRRRLVRQHGWLLHTGRTPSPRIDGAGNATPGDPAQGTAMGFWKPYSGYTLDGTTPVSGWEVEWDPVKNPGFRRIRNKALEPWKQTDKRTYEVRMSEKTKRTEEGGVVTGRHTHPLPDNPIWKRAPVPSRNGVITSRSKPVVVDARLRVVDISNIDTVHGTATICVQVCLFWTDPRMIGYDHQVLPDKLWGPRLELQNVVDGQVEETQLAFQRMETGRFFSHHDAVCKAARDFKCKYPRPDLPGSENLPWPESGRMSRIIEYTATVKKTMSSFADFPFDLDRIDLSWVTSSSFETLDRSERGQRISRTAWKLRWIQKFGDSGQISQLKAFYQAKYQAEKRLSGTPR